MKRIAKILSFLLICSMMSMVSANETESVDTKIDYANSVTSASLAAWKNYLFAATDKGVEIKDVSRENANTAVWSFGSKEIPGISSPIPTQIAVTDDYIIIAFGSPISIFRNSGSFSEEKPELICSLSGLKGIPRMRVHSDKLYLVDMPVRAVQGKKIATAWQVDLSRTEEFPVNNNKVANMTEVGMLDVYSKSVEFGDMTSLWSATGINGNYLCCIGSKKGSDALLLLKLQTDNFTADGLTETELDGAGGFAEGTFTVNGSYIFAVTNASQGNKLYIIDTDTGSVSAKELVSSIYSGWQASIVAGNVLIGLMSTIKDRLAVMDISDPGNLSTNMSENLPLTSGISTSSVFSNIIKIGNRLYYAMADNSGIGVIKLTGTDFSLNADETVNKFPTVIYGRSDEPEVTVTVGETEKTVKTARGMYSLKIYEYPNGTVTVTAGDKSIDMNIAVEETEKKAEIVCENAKMTATVTALEENYTVCTVYDSEGTAKEIKSLTGSGSIEADLPENGYAKLCILKSEAEQIYEAEAYKINYDGTVEKTEDMQKIIGENELVLNELVFTEAMKAQISGTAQPGSMVTVKVLCGDTLKDISVAYADENGSFAAEYSYKGALAEEEYTVIAAACGGSDVTKSFKASDTNALTEAVQYIKENVKTAAELDLYMSENSEKAAALGFDFSADEMKELTEGNLAAVKEAALTAFVAGEDVKAATADKCKKLLEKQYIDEINGATSASFGGILQKLYEKGYISEEIYESYTDCENKEKVYTEFSKGGSLSALADLGSRLTGAITEANKPVEGGTSGTTTGGGGSRGGSSSVSGKTSSITMPPVIAEPITQQKKPEFDDIDSVPWAKDAILYLAEKEIIIGKAERIFDPNGEVTREQFIKMLVLAFDMSADKKECSFSDVEEGKWYYEYIAVAEKSGLTKGEGGSFGIGRSLTREEMATFAYRAAGIAGIEMEICESEFADAAEISDYALEAVGAMSKAGIINGVGEGRFAPKDTCTRAMAAKVICSILSLNENGGV